MSSLVERLRLMPKSFPGLQVCDEAAARIKALEAALWECIEALEFNCDATANRALDIAREALAPETVK